MSQVLDQNREYISTTEAAERSGLTPHYLRKLLKDGKLEGTQLIRSWVIYTDSLDKFLATPRKSGPKGPTGTRKKATEKDQPASSPKKGAD